MTSVRSFRRKLELVEAKVWSKARKVVKLFGQPDEVDQILAKLQDTNAAGLAGKVVVISGSSKGVGRALAQVFAERGAKVVVNGRSRQDVEKAVHDIRAGGWAAAAVEADVSADEGAKALLDGALRAYGRVDILINNAAVAGPSNQKAWDVDAASFEKVVQTNLNGAFFCAKHFMAWMVENGVAGRIINVSTGAAQAGHPGMAPYVASKFGLEGLTKALALDADHSGISVLAIRIGSTQSEMAKQVFSWEEFHSLPPPEIVAGVFLYAATGPGQLLNGRVLASWRFLRDEFAESRLNSNLALMPKFKWNPPAMPKHLAPHDIVPLERAENPYGMPDSVRDLFSRPGASWELNRYPDFTQQCLRDALAKRFNLPADCFTVSNGSGELVERVLRTWVHTGDEVLSNDPSWFMFDRLCDMYGIINKKVRFQRGPSGEYHHNLDGLADAIDVRTRLIYLINPANPVGVPIIHEQFRDFLKKIPAHLPVIVDEAYFEFRDREDILRTERVVLETDRTVIALRTFSKFYGLAGVRVGYAFASAQGIDLLGRLEMPFSVSTFSAAAACAALSDEAHWQRTHNGIRTERDRIQKFFQSKGLEYIPSQANLIMVECPCKPQKFYQATTDAGMILPKGIFMDKFTLFPISLPEHNDRTMRVRGVLLKSNREWEL